MYKLVCNETFGCVRHPPDCIDFKDTENPCIIRLKTDRDNKTKTLNVEIMQRSKNSSNVTTTPNFKWMAEKDTFLPDPKHNDLMFFILGKKSAKDKMMFMCHIGQKQVICSLLSK